MVNQSIFGIAPQDPIIDAQSSPAGSGPLFNKLKSRFSFWRTLNKNQKISLVSLVVILLIAPLGVYIALNPKNPLFPWASEVTTPPVTPPVTPPDETSSPVPTPISTPRPSPSPRPTISPTPVSTATPGPNSIPIIYIKSLGTGAVGKEYKYPVVGYDFNSTDSLVMTISNLPAGLRQDENCVQEVKSNRKYITCQIIGIPLQAGKYSVHIKLEDNHGGKVEKNYTLPVR